MYSPGLTSGNPPNGGISAVEVTRGEELRRCGVRELGRSRCRQRRAVRACAHARTRAAPPHWVTAAPDRPARDGREPSQDSLPHARFARAERRARERLPARPGLRP